MRLFLFLLLISTATPALQADSFLKKCPCGPDAIPGPLRLLLPQGHRGADFRPWCRKHDACYDTLGSCRHCCDDVFLKDLLSECENSKRPKGCRRRARLFHWVLSRFGEGPFKSAQKLAAQKVEYGK